MESKGIDDNGSEIKRRRRYRDTHVKEGKPLYFETCLKRHHRSRIVRWITHRLITDRKKNKSSCEILLYLVCIYVQSLRKEFSEASNMKVKKTVRMEYLGCSRHGVSVEVDNRPQSYRIDLAKGWPQFREANGLMYGKWYCFEFNPDDQVIYVCPKPNN